LNGKVQRKCKITEINGASDQHAKPHFSRDAPKLITSSQGLVEGPVHDAAIWKVPGIGSIRTAQRRRCAAHFAVLRNRYPFAGFFWLRSSSGRRKGECHE
jgi:hypothetical protein